MCTEDEQGVLGKSEEYDVVPLLHREGKVPFHCE